jgi:hypothetical protein
MAGGTPAATMSLPEVGCDVVGAGVPPALLDHGEKKGSGRGSTKKGAEQRAAREAMISIQEKIADGT